MTDHSTPASVYINACNRERTEVIPEFIDALDNCHRDCSLSSRARPLTDIDMQCISEALGTPHALKCLAFEENAFTSEGVKSTLEALAANPGCLRELRLGKNKLKDQAAVVIANALANNGMGLKVLDLSENGLTKVGCNALCQAIGSKACDLVEVSFHNNQLEPEIGVLLAQAIRESPKLKHLHLGYNHLKDAGATQLARVIPIASSLSTLDLTANRIGPQGGQELARALMSNNCMLQRLNLRHNNFDDETLQLFSEVLLRNTSLTQLFLGFMSPTPETAALVLTSLRHNKTLLLLDIYGWKLDLTVCGQIIEDIMFHNISIRAITTDACQPIYHTIDRLNKERESRGLHEVYIGPDDRHSAHAASTKSKSGSTRAASHASHQMEASRGRSTAAIVQSSSMPSNHMSNMQTVTQAQMSADARASPQALHSASASARGTPAKIRQSPSQMQGSVNTPRNSAADRRASPMDRADVQAAANRQTVMTRSVTDSPRDSRQMHSIPVMQQSQTPGMHTQQGGFNAQAAAMQPQTMGVHSQSSGLHTQPTGLHSQPTGLHSQPTGLHSQPTGLHAQPTVMQQNQPILVDSTSDARRTSPRNRGQAQTTVIPPNQIVTVQTTREFRQTSPGMIFSSQNAIVPRQQNITAVTSIQPMALNTAQRSSTPQNKRSSPTSVDASGQYRDLRGMISELDRASQAEKSNRLLSNILSQMVQKIENLEKSHDQRITNLERRVSTCEGQVCHCNETSPDKSRQLVTVVQSRASAQRSKTPTQQAYGSDGRAAYTVQTQQSSAAANRQHLSSPMRGSGEAERRTQSSGFMCQGFSQREFEACGSAQRIRGQGENNSRPQSAMRNRGTDLRPPTAPMQYKGDTNEARTGYTDTWQTSDARGIRYSSAEHRSTPDGYSSSNQGSCRNQDGSGPASRLNRVQVSTGQSRAGNVQGGQTPVWTQSPMRERRSTSVSVIGVPETIMRNTAQSTPAQPNEPSPIHEASIPAPDLQPSYQAAGNAYLESIPASHPYDLPGPRGQFRKSY